jgi:glutathione S-transferase
VIGPAILRWAIRRSVLASLHAHGLGRHTPAQIGARLAEDFAALADALGVDPYFGGAEPGTLDASAWAMLASVLEAPHRSPVYDALADQPRLVAYVGRFRGRLPTAWPGTAG